MVMVRFKIMVSVRLEMFGSWLGSNCHVYGNNQGHC